MKSNRLFETFVEVVYVAGIFSVMTHAVTFY